MKKIVNFSMEYDNNEITEFDNQNGYDADYLGVSRINGKDLLFARVRHEKGNSNCNKIIMLEVAYDEDRDHIFYNADPTSEYYWFDTPLNYSIDDSESRKLFKSGSSVHEVLDSLEISHKKSPLKDKIESLFTVFEEYSMPRDEDYNEIEEKYKIDDTMKIFDAEVLNIYGIPFEYQFKRCSSFKEDKPYIKKKTR